MKTDSVLRITLSFVMLVVCAVMHAGLTGLLPDDRKFASEQRARLSEMLATSITFALTNHRFQDAGVQLEYFAKRNPELRSCAVRREDGVVIVEVGSHSENWVQAADERNDGCYVVPLVRGKNKWGSLELQFDPLYAGVNRWVSTSQIKFVVLLASITALGAWLQLRKMLKFFDPKRAVPPRVQDALDNFAEGVVVLNQNDEIVLANDAFAGTLDTQPAELVGKKFWELPWTFAEEKPVRDSSRLKNTRMHLANKATSINAIFSVNSSPVIGEDGVCQGHMLAFNDITALERNRTALLLTLEDLSRSREEIAEQNKELKYLATRDPLTSCVNRRTFFQKFEEYWEDCARSSKSLSVIMVDIDFFKSINDNYGHSAGDEVLRAVGGLLDRKSSSRTVASRYGGEEFALLLAEGDITSAASFAEELRQEISQLQFSFELSITASLGVSSYSCQPTDPQDMLDQADRCLYVAKRNGRNQVVRFDEVPEDLVVDESLISRTKPDTATMKQPTIPYRAVSALVSALSYRDPDTGAHSVRVANLAALFSQSFVGPQEAYVIEIAALLHDIGKVGVPDSILLKNGRLTAEEWKVMERHDQIGIEIISKSFEHSELTEIIRCHHYFFDGSGRTTQTVCGTEIPLGARILSIVDAFDAMVSDRPYRRGMTTDDAIAELIRCRGQQFDPSLVDQFVEQLRNGSILNAAVDAADASPHGGILAIGEQVERLVQSASEHNKESFIALTTRLKELAESSQLQSLANKAELTIACATESQQLESISQELNALLAECRTICNQNALAANNERTGPAT